MPRALILGPQRRSMVSSNPITTGAVAGRKDAISSNRSRLAAARDDQAARLRIRWKVQNLGSRSSPRMRSAAAMVRRPGVRMTPARSNRTFGQVGRVNRSAKPARQERNCGGRGSGGAGKTERKTRGGRKKMGGGGGGGGGGGDGSVSSHA